MKTGDLLDGLGLPAAAVQRERVPKTALVDQLDKAADRRLVNERVESLLWHATLNAGTTGLPADGTPSLVVARLTTRDGPPAPPPRLLALLHRVVPAPLLLAVDHVDHPEAVTLSIKPGLGEVLACEVPESLPPEVVALLAVDRATSLGDLHRRWADAVLGVIAWHATGRVPARDGAGTPEASAERRDALTRVVALDKEIARLTAAAKRERQAGRRAELNERLQEARRQRRAAADAV